MRTVTVVRKRGKKSQECLCRVSLAGGKAFAFELGKNTFKDIPLGVARQAVATGHFTIKPFTPPAPQQRPTPKTPAATAKATGSKEGGK